MKIRGYDTCASLEEVATLASKSVIDAGEPWVNNFCIKVLIPVQLLAQPELLDVAAKAELWQQTTCPKGLFFSHGQFLGEHGIQHIADELKAKPDSNRALVSLISVQNIVGIGDKPLPSFLIFQCMLEGPVLYVTAVYRAMEVTNFLRINLEEIRMMTLKVYEANRTATHVALCIFVTRAYAKSDMNTLEKCEIDQIPQVEIITNHRHRLPTILRDKSRHSTYPDATGLENLLSIATNSILPLSMQLPGNGPALQDLLRSAIRDTHDLQRLRQTASHHPDIAALEERIKSNLEKLASMIESAIEGATS